MAKRQPPLHLIEVGLEINRCRYLFLLASLPFSPRAGLKASCYCRSVFLMKASQSCCFSSCQGGLRREKVRSFQLVPGTFPARKLIRSQLMRAFLTSVFSGQSPQRIGGRGEALAERGQQRGKERAGRQRDALRFDSMQEAPYTKGRLASSQELF